MAEVKRYGGRTYAKSQVSQPQDSSSASKAFDEVFAKPKNTKWGNVSYVKPRHDTDDVEKKQKPQSENQADEDQDPFSFEFDSDKSPKKQKSRLHTRTVVMQPAVRITSAGAPTKPPPRSTPRSGLDDDGVSDELTVRKSNAITYSKGAGRKIKQEYDTSQMDTYVQQNNKRANDFYSTDSSQGTPQSSSEHPDSQDTSDDPDEGFYIEHDDGSSNPSPAEQILVPKDEKEDIFHRPKREMHPMTTKDGDEITVRFRSQYLNPEVYSKFTENIKPKDPVGRLSNSKVVHKNVLKHDSGTTLIVVCSPKVDSDLKQSTTQSKYFKDNVKELVKSKKKPVERLAKGRRGKKTPPEKDPFEMEDDPEWTPDGDSSSQGGVIGQETEVESPLVMSVESPLVMSGATEEDTAHSQETYTTRSGRTTKNAVTFEDEQEEQQTHTVKVENIVKNVKAAPPRKYHRIFRSRNRGFMDPNIEREESPSLEEAKVECASPVPERGSGDLVVEITVKQNGESETTAGESEATAGESEAMDTQESSQTDEGTVKVENSGTGESDIESSQQSNVSDSQGADNESSSQDVEEPQPKKIRTAKTPPAERKIFRARGNKGAAPGAQKKIFSSPKKAAAVYNVRSWQDEEEMPEISRPSSGLTTMAPPSSLPEPPKLKPAVKKPVAGASKPRQQEMPRLTRAVHWQRHQDDDAYTSVHVNKEHRDLFTVVKNVKEAHECQEHGETQEFDDDIEYLLAGIEAIEPMSTRCLSCVGLAQKCTIPAFRMHLRAHGTVTKIFGCLQDAAGDPSLALCTSALMFMLSRDRLNMDLDQESLNLMLRLLGVDQHDEMYTTLSPTAERALKRNKDRVLEVYKEFLQQSGTKQDSIDLELLSTGNLAMESLLSLTSRRAGEWFKEELRTLGALDHIVDTVCSCVDMIGDKVTMLTNSNIENLKKVDRCLRVLENVTYMNADNQNYLIAYKNTCLIPSLSRALRVCRTCLSLYPLSESKPGKVDKESFGWVIYSCILAELRVLLNLTHDNDIGCVKIGEQTYGLETVLLCILQSPQYVPIDLRFDLYVLSLGLLINLVEHNDVNRNQLLTLKTQSLYECRQPISDMLAFLSLVEVFKRREEAAQQLEEADEPKTPEQSPNKSGEWRESDSGMEWIIDSNKKSTGKKGGAGGNDDKDLDDEETFTKALHNAGKHMENSIVAAYVALLVGCLIQENQECKASVKQSLPEQKFDGMIYMLKKFLGFMNLTSGTGSAGGKSIERVIEILEKC